MNDVSFCYNFRKTFLEMLESFWIFLELLTEKVITPGLKKIVVTYILYPIIYQNMTLLLGAKVYHGNT